MEENKKETTEMLHSFASQSVTSLFSSKFLGIIAVVVLVGVAVGYFASSKGGIGLSTGSTTLSAGSKVEKGTIVGSDDTKTFNDKTEGVLEAGGIEGEGQFHLVRPGGDSQNVYLTSSIVDLSQFIKKKIRVWGQTNSAKKAGWLMDVGRVEVL